MKISGQRNVTVKNRAHIYYGWVIVTVCVIQQALQYGIYYSFGIFFKPLIADFGWSRAALSGVYSLSMFCGGLLAIPAGWLADKFGPARVTAVCGFLIGLGLILTSQITDLGQIYLTYGLILGVGSSGIFAISGGITARWFYKKRGLALGIVAAGVGLGTLVMPPLTERLIDSFGWSQAYLVIGIVSMIILIGSALFLHRDPKDIGCLPYGAPQPDTPDNTQQSDKAVHTSLDGGMTLWSASRTSLLWMLVFIFMSFNACTQMIIVHLANYATDIGIAPLVAATIVSAIGIGSIVGRLIMGTAADRLGNDNSLIICSIIQTLSLVWLIFAGQIWALYGFAVVFSFAYGGEVPLMTLLVSEKYGLKAVSALVGVMVLATRIGATLGSWAGGYIFDITGSYTTAFIIAATVSLMILAVTFIVKKVKPVGVG